MRTIGLVALLGVLALATPHSARASEPNEHGCYPASAGTEQALRVYRRRAAIDFDVILPLFIQRLSFDGYFQEAHAVNDRMLEIRSTDRELHANDLHDHLYYRGLTHLGAGDYEAAIADAEAAEAVLQEAGRGGYERADFARLLTAEALIEAERYEEAASALGDYHTGIMANDCPGWCASDLEERLRYYALSYELSLYQGQLHDAYALATMAVGEILDWHNTDIELPIVAMSLSNHARIASLLGHFDEAEASLATLAERTSVDPCHLDIDHDLQSMILAYERGDLEGANALATDLAVNILSRLVALQQASFVGTYAIYQIRRLTGEVAVAADPQQLLEFYRLLYPAIDVDNPELAYRFATALQARRMAVYPWDMVDQLLRY